MEIVGGVSAAVVVTVAGVLRVLGTFVTGVGGVGGALEAEGPEVVDYRLEKAGKVRI